MIKHKVGVLGCGFVGSAVSTGFETVLGDKIEILEYDKYKDTESLATTVEESDILFLCLPTPMSENGSCDTSILESVIQEISMITFQNKLLVIKSTVPPSTTEKLSKRYERFDFCFNPEFLVEKTFIEDFINQDRIFLGWPTKKPSEKNLKRINSLYRDFIEERSKKGLTYNITTNFLSESSDVVEMSKYVCNTFLTTKVLFFNEMYEICKNSNIDYKKVSQLATLDNRVGNSHTKVPGPDGQFGAGGACFWKDLNGLIAYAKDVGVDPLVLDSVLTKNLLVREVYDWEKLSQVNGNYKNKK